VAERLSAATGHQVGSVDVPADTFGQALVGAGLPRWLVDRLIELNRMMADGHAAGVTDEVARLIGRQPRTLAQFAAEHRAIFGGHQWTPARVVAVAAWLRPWPPSRSGQPRQSGWSQPLLR
jgi:hypothetical protein